MTSQGQRFRRRALRRGYKVDEVDSFLDRVEATLAGDPAGAPVASQEVHDVVFRVRFGGYDEWQVDLHLDRVERQLAELEERGGMGRGPDPRSIPDRMPSPMDRMGPGRLGPDRMEPDRMLPGRMGPPDRMEPDRMGPGRMGPPDRMQPDRMGPPMRDDRELPPMPQPMPPRPVAPLQAQAGPPRDPYGRYDEPTYAPPASYEPPPGRFGGGGPQDRFDGFEPGRHGKMDMTAEIRMPEREMRGQGMPGPPPMSPPRGGPSMGGPPMGGPPMGGPPMPGAGGDLHRVDQLRRTFQPRRFGSGYDPSQVDRLFEALLAAMSGRGPMPVNEADLDTLQFGLVPGGYFEAEVDAALREVRDILRRR